MSYYFVYKLAVFHKTCGTKTKWGRPARSVPQLPAEKEHP